MLSGKHILQINNQNKKVNVKTKLIFIDLLSQMRVIWKLKHYGLIYSRVNFWGKIKILVILKGAKGVFKWENIRIVHVPAEVP